MTIWTTDSIPSLTGTRAIVTGATGGLGLETASVLAAKGAEVIVAGRSVSKGEAALRRIVSETPEAAVRFGEIDLADLESVSDFAAAELADGRPVDLLVNNAGVMAVPDHRMTVDGFELQFGTNFLGHFALTLRLLPALRAAAAPRVVNLSSLTHRQGNIDFDNLQFERNYSPFRAYAQSKLAMLLFTLELQRRSAAGNWNLLATTAHPGWARTDLVANGPASGSSFNFSAAMTKLLAPLLGQGAAQGAWPTLYAATSPDVTPAGYYGPSGMNEFKGPPAPAKKAKRAEDTETAKQLWKVAEELTGCTAQP